MLLAHVTDGSNLFGLFLLLHIVAVVVAFAPAFVNPLLTARAKSEGQPLPSSVLDKIAKDTQQVHGPSLVLAGLFGVAMIGTSHQLYKFSQMWISAALLIWVIMVGVVFGLLWPAQKKVAAGDAAADKKVAMFGGIMHLLFLIMLVLMIFKPGFPS